MPPAQPGAGSGSNQAMEPTDCIGGLCWVAGPALRVRAAVVCAHALGSHCRENPFCDVSALEPRDCVSLLLRVSARPPVGTVAL